MHGEWRGAIEPNVISHSVPVVPESPAKTLHHDNEHTENKIG